MICVKKETDVTIKLFSGYLFRLMYPNNNTSNNTIVSNINIIICIGVPLLKKISNTSWWYGRQ